MAEKRTIEEYMQEQDPRHDGSSTSIQWKGTGVCMDFHCKCGHHMHFDSEFLYFVLCNRCGAKYAMGRQVRCIEILPEHDAEVSGSLCLWTNDENEESVRVSDLNPETDAGHVAFDAMEIKVDTHGKV